MIQVGSFLTVTDNSGARKALCIGLYSGFKRRFAGIGDVVLVSIKRLRSKRRDISKAKKGQIYKALIIRVKNFTMFYNNLYNFSENSIVLLNNKNKLLGTRIFGSVHKSLRYTKYLKLASLALGIVS